MNTIFSVLLACIVSLSAFVGFAPSASAGHVYLNLEELQCPLSGRNGFYRYALSWKSQDFVPSIPEVNEYKRFFPIKEGEGDCYANVGVIKVNQKFQFPVDRNILLQPAVGNGSTPLQPFVVPAIQNTEGTQTTTTEANGYKTTIKYKVTFE
ncbi:hypothetical protein JYQ62_16245 [Nostoc sp. UHCC 0702]|nr:hypothetical protein JYQ62_16245 [Nostoc sp. UHCC 0702]